MQSELRTLKELCSLIADCPHSTPVWTDSGYIVIRNQNIKGGRLDLSDASYTDAVHFAHRIRRAKPTGGDIIFTREAPMGEVCMIPHELELLRLVEKWDKHLSTAGRFGRFSRTGNRPAVGKCVAACYAV